MHIRRAAHHLPQRRGLERVAQLYRGRKQPAASDIGVLGRPDVVERTVRKCKPVVTTGATALVVEYFKATLGGCADCAVIAFDPAIKGRLLADDRAFECRECKLNISPRNA